MPSNFGSVRAVVFDAVGTLIYPDPPVAVAYQQLGQQHGSQLTREDIARNFRHAIHNFPYQATTNEHLERERWRQVVACVFNDIDDTERLFRELWDHFAHPANWSVYEDVPDAVSKLQSLGYLTAIGSNFDDRLLAIVPELPTLNRIESIFVSSQLGFTKPAVEFFRAIELELGFRAEQLLMVGDDPRNDFAGATTAGWRSLLLNRPQTDGTTGSIRSLRDIASWFA